MEVINALKAIYENSDDKVIFTNARLVVLWRSKESLPKYLSVDNIRISKNTPVTLPIGDITVCRYSDGLLGFTMRMIPIKEKDETAGYLIHCFNEYDVDRLTMQSVLKERIRKDLEAVRFEAGCLINLLNLHRKSWTMDGGNDYSDFDDQSRGKVLGIMSSISNYEEISIYLGDNISSEYNFMSVVLGNLADRIRCRAEKAGYSFECDVRSMVHIPMNTERFEVAVANLIANAYMYNSKSEKSCRIELYKEGGKVVVSVTDNGDGISPEKLAMLRNPFDYFNSDDLHESLGLTVAMLYSQSFGGKLEIDSVVGEYTKVMMIFEDHGEDVPHEFRRFTAPCIYATDIVACILGKCFGYFDDDTYKL